MLGVFDCDNQENKEPEGRSEHRVNSYGILTRKGKKKMLKGVERLFHSIVENIQIILKLCFSLQ